MKQPSALLLIAVLVRRNGTLLKLAPLACAMCVVAGAREQCIPGPFHFEGGQFCESPDDCGGNPCVDGFCQTNSGPVASQCTSDNECPSAGPDSPGRCENGRCVGGDIVGGACQLGFDGNCTNGDSCAFNPASQNPFNEGRCLPRAASPAGFGAACDAAADPTVNPCDRGLFCLPVGAGDGLCVGGCDNRDGSCDQGTCSFPYYFDPRTGGGNDARPVCMPGCNLDTLDCPTDVAGGRLLCAQASGIGQPACTPDSGACIVAGCDADGCDAGCADQTDCAVGTFCLASVIDSCRVNGTDQTFSTCQPPAGENQPCIPAEPGSCDDGLACSPFNGGTPTCIQQVSTPIADGGDCNSNERSGNLCERGSFCARSETGPTGTCMRFCDDEDDCDAGDACVGANLAGTFGPEESALDDLRVCAAPCVDDGDCGRLSCDVDGAACTAGGFCAPFEQGAPCNFGQPACSDGQVCGANDRCTRPEDTCFADTCDLLDTSTCGADFACSPFEGDTPVCVPRNTGAPRADGSNCDTVAEPVQCLPGSICNQGCQKVCDDDNDCTGPQLCVRGNVRSDNGPGDPNTAFDLYDIKVCASPCTSNVECGGSPFSSCDFDDTPNCSTGEGFCLRPEQGSHGCSSDAECSDVPGTECDGTATGQCLPPADICQ